MKRLSFLIVVLMVFAISLTAKDWLVMVYFGGDNSLSGAIVGDVDEIEAAYSVSGDIDIVIQCDGNSADSYVGYADATGSDISTVRRYRLLPDGNNISNAIDEAPIADLGELNSSDPAVIADFVKWAVENYPADHYMLILWDHGAGWVKGEVDKGGLWDDTSDDYLSSAGGEWRTLLDSINKIIGGKLDILGNDMCVMSYMEMLWDVAPYVNMYVSSEANEPWDGWYYNNWISNLNKYGSTATLEDIGQWIVDDYADYYNGSTAATLTYQIITDDVTTLKDKIYYLAKELINNNGGRDATAVQTCIDNALPMSSGTFYEDFKDLWSFCDELINNSSITDSAQALAADIQILIDNLNPYDWQYGFNGSHGLGIYLPDDDNIYYFDYPYDSPTHAWNVDCPAWTSFIYGETSFAMEIEKFEKPVIPENNDKGLTVIANGVKCGSNEENITIYDMTGRMVENVNLNPNEIYYMNHLKNGLYLVKDSNNNIYKVTVLK